MEALIIILVWIIVILYYKRLSKFVYAFAITDIALRILSFIRANLGSPEISSFISKYFPSSIVSIIEKYTDGTFTDILIWAYVILFIIFEFYIIRAFIKNKKL